MLFWNSNCNNIDLMLNYENHYIPVIFLAQIQASHAGEIQHDGKKFVSTHSEIRFQIWYDDELHE